MRGTINMEVEVHSAELGCSARVSVPETWTVTEPIGATRAVVIDRDAMVDADFVPNLLLQVVASGEDDPTSGALVLSDRWVGSNGSRRVRTLILEMFDLNVVEQMVTVTSGDVEARLAMSATEAQWPALAGSIDQVAASLRLDVEAS